jgi:molybdopterin synthase catalytic subunit
MTHAGPAADAPATCVAQVRRARVTEEPLDLQQHAHEVEHVAAGAIATFAGVVRDHDGGRGVTALDYSCHPQAQAIIERVVTDIASSATGVRAISVSHRVGPLQIGDIALACAVSADHRREAFEVCATLVDEVKAQLPVWKHQIFTDGSDEWVNCT